MSVSVKDCLELGLLKNAVVVAGKSGLWRSVECVSVFEFDGFEENMRSILSGHEFAITALSFLRGRGQEEWERFFHAAFASGISCMAIFYSGLIADALPQSILDMADTANIPLMIFPEGGRYAYSDVLMTVAEAIIHDKRNKSINNMLFSDILNQVISSEPRQQNIHTLLELLSSRTDYDLILTDDEFSPYAWSLLNLDFNLSAFLQEIYQSIGRILPQTPQVLRQKLCGEDVNVRFQPLRTKKLVGMLVLLHPGNQAIDIDLATQSAELICLFLQLWRLSQGRPTELQLQLDGNPQSIRRSRFHKLAVLGTSDGTPLEINELTFAKLKINHVDGCDFPFQIVCFKDSVVMACYHSEDDLTLLFNYVRSLIGGISKLYFGELELNQAMDAQKAFHLIQHTLPTAAKLFPDDSSFQAAQIRFAAQIQQLQQSMGSALYCMADILTPLCSQGNWDRAILTLSVLYLDCGGSMSQAAEKLHLHANTIKYRVNRIKELLNMDFELPLNFTRLITALAVIRLTESKDGQA